MLGSSVCRCARPRTCRLKPLRLILVRARGPRTKNRRTTVDARRLRDITGSTGRCNVNRACDVLLGAAQRKSAKRGGRRHTGTGDARRTREPRARDPASGLRLRHEPRAQPVIRHLRSRVRSCLVRHISMCPQAMANSNEAERIRSCLSAQGADAASLSSRLHRHVDHEHDVSGIGTTPPHTPPRQRWRRTARTSTATAVPASNHFGWRPSSWPISWCISWAAS